MDFVINNYVWFMVIGVLFVFALIGYIADNMHFEKKATKIKEKNANDRNKKREKAKKEKSSVLETANLPHPELLDEIINNSDLDDFKDEPSSPMDAESNLMDLYDMPADLDSNPADSEALSMKAVDDLPKVEEEFSDVSTSVEDFNDLTDKIDNSITDNNVISDFDDLSNGISDLNGSNQDYINVGVLSDEAVDNSNLSEIADVDYTTSEEDKHQSKKSNKHKHSKATDSKDNKKKEENHITDELLEDIADIKPILDSSIKSMKPLDSEEETDFWK